MMEYLLIILLSINLVSFVIYGIDKWKAKHDKWRISEMTLLTLAFCGGALGSLLGMYVFHHKTQHAKFKILVPLFLGLQIAAMVWVIASISA